jgi:hypothetical protein
MTYKPARVYNGVVGQPSKDSMGPETLSADIDKIIKMFDPSATHDDGQQGGIGKGNLNFNLEEDGSGGGDSMAETIGSKEISELKDPSSPPSPALTVWKQIKALVLLLAGYIKADGDQTISGVKTFSNSPIIPAPTAAMQPATKKYVDDVATGLVVGTLPDGSVADEKLAADNKVGSLATLLTTVKDSVVGALNEIWNGLDSLAGAIADAFTALAGKAEKDTEIILVTENKTLGLSDKATFQQCYSVDPIVITIPEDELPVKYEVVFARDGVGTVRPVPENENVNLESVDGKTYIKLYGSATLKQVAPNDWRLYGALE